MKKILVVGLILIVTIFAVVGCDTTKKESEQQAQEQVKEEFKVAMVTDVGGLGDQSFNDAAYRGLKQLEEELGAEIQVVESNDMADYVPNLRSLADQGYDMVWAIGFLMTDALKEVALDYPDTHFGIIDSVVEADNVASVTFKEEEGSFLVGVVAGLMTKTNKVGFIGGMDFPIIRKFECGFRAGVKAVKPDAEIFIAYTGAFDDPAGGKELALTQFNQGADIIFHASGACGTGVIKAAEEMGPDYFAIGVDSPQYHLAPESVLTSMVKRVDVGVFDISKLLYEDKFEARHYVLGLKEDGVGTSEHLKEMAPQKVIDKVEEYKDKIINGEIKVPATREELENFEL